MRQHRSRPLCEELHLWLQLERQRVREGSGISRSHRLQPEPLGSADALPGRRRCADRQQPLREPDAPLGDGSKGVTLRRQRIGRQRAAVIMSLLQSAKLNGHDPWAYLEDVLTRLPTHLNSRIDELLPHRWQPQL